MKRFRVLRGWASWHLYDNTTHREVQTFPTRAEARKWAKLANHPNASLSWVTGKLISITNGVHDEAD